MPDLPLTPDFDSWPVVHAATAVKAEDEVLSVTWSDGSTCRYHALMLRENSPDAETIHPLAREMAIAPTMIATDLTIRSAGIDEAGAIAVAWSDDTTSRYHPGWLHAHGWFGPEALPRPQLWNADSLSQPPTFDGPAALADSAVFLQWLEALRDFGVARLRGLPQQDGLLEQIVTRIGPIRESNFGRQYVLEIKDDPDSSAYTANPLLQHIDLPTRETPHGLQFLYCRENTTPGGEGIYTDAYRIAEDMRIEAPEHFESLIRDVWEYNNRARNSDYRARGPVVELNADGQITGIRYNSFLRAPMKAPVEIQSRAYRAYRAFCARAQSEHYQMRIRYRPGDLLAFDNRRVLHGRAGYDAAGGKRFIEGIYSDRDELYSRIRLLKRQQRQLGE